MNSNNTTFFVFVMFDFNLIFKFNLIYYFYFSFLILI